MIRVMPGQKYFAPHDFYIDSYRNKKKSMDK